MIYSTARTLMVNLWSGVSKKGNKVGSKANRVDTIKNIVTQNKVRAIIPPMPPESLTIPLYPRSFTLDRSPIWHDFLRQIR